MARPTANVRLEFRAGGVSIAMFGTPDMTLYDPPTPSRYQHLGSKNHASALDPHKYQQLIGIGKNLVSS